MKTHFPFKRLPTSKRRPTRHEIISLINFQQHMTYSNLERKYSIVQQYSS